MRRVGKLMYEWVGFDHLPGLLEQLAQDEANGALRPPCCSFVLRLPCCSCCESGQWRAVLQRQGLA